MKYLFLSVAVLLAAIYIAVSYQGPDQPAPQEVEAADSFQLDSRPAPASGGNEISTSSGDSLGIAKLANRKIVASTGIPNGKYRALAIDDGWNLDCYLVEVDAKKIKFAFSGPTKGAYFAAISPNETYLASGKIFKTPIVIWDIETGKVAKELPGHELATRSVAFSPDESRLASLSFDGEVCIWDLVTLSKLDTKTVNPDQARTLQFTSVGVKVLTKDATVIPFNEG